MEDRLARSKAFGEHGGVNPSIETSTTFTVMSAETMPQIFSGAVGPDKGGCYVYGRAFNPTVRELSKQLAAVEDMEAGYATASGMAAISGALLALCSAGDHIVASNTVYGGTFALLKTFLPAKCGISVTLVDITDHDAVAAAFTPRTKVLFCEAMSNPTLVVADLPALAHLGHGGNPHGARSALVVDNTFTPCIITPAHHGADVVIHSLTKFISGASDIIAGAVCGSASFITSLTDFHMGPMMLLGPTMDPRIAAELALRLPHLGLRIQEHSRRAAVLAARLQSLGAPVTYPGLPSHPQHALLKRLANPGYGLGGLVGIDMGTRARADALMERLQNKHAFGYMAVSLGYADTLMSASSASTSSELSPAEKAASGIRDGYVRMSVGITGSLEQRWAQLQEAYCHVAGLPLPHYTTMTVTSAAAGGVTLAMTLTDDVPDGHDVFGGIKPAAAPIVEGLLAVTTTPSMSSEEEADTGLHVPAATLATTAAAAAAVTITATVVTQRPGHPEIQTGDSCSSPATVKHHTHHPHQAHAGHHSGAAAPRKRSAEQMLGGGDE